MGVVFPQTEIGADPGGLRAYAEAATELGYAHLLAYDHVLGADRTVHPDLPGPYGVDDPFHEPMVLFGWLAAFCPLELVTGILIAPQRQTALVAKQAAEVAVLAGPGRLRLGLGVGWNHVEYDALGVPFTRRGALLDEQIPLLRLFWSERCVTFSGRFHTVEAAGLAPLPPAAIPIWLGAFAEPSLRRVGRLADGWFPLVNPGGPLENAVEVVAAAARQSGRDPAAIGMEGRVSFEGDPERLGELAGRWRLAGATHLSVDTMRQGHQGPDPHIAAIAAAAEVLGLRPAS